MKTILFFISFLLTISYGCQGQENSNTSQSMISDSIKNKRDEEWKKILTPEQYYITRQKGTERPFTGIYWNHFEKGEYYCVCCHTLLFQSSHKFQSSCGWPSFYEQDPNAKIELKKDYSHGMIRTEVLCESCGAHLGHIFDDGPPPTGKRYCINSESLVFKPLQPGHP